MGMKAHGQAVENPARRRLLPRHLPGKRAAEELPGRSGPGELPRESCPLAQDLRGLPPLLRLDGEPFAPAPHDPERDPWGVYAPLQHLVDLGTSLTNCTKGCVGEASRGTPLSMTKRIAKTSSHQWGPWPERPGSLLTSYRELEGDREVRLVDDELRNSFHRTNS
jgi:hypothetical protein